MARPDSEWVAVAWLTDTGTAGNVAAYLETCGLRARAAEGGTFALGEAPVFVEAAQVERAHDLLRRLEAGEFEPDGEMGSAESLAEELVKELSAAKDYSPPSKLALWAPFVLVPAGIMAIFLIAFGLKIAVAWLGGR